MQHFKTWTEGFNGTKKQEKYHNQGCRSRDECRNNEQKTLLQNRLPSSQRQSNLQKNWYYMWPQGNEKTKTKNKTKNNPKLWKYFSQAENLLLNKFSASTSNLYGLQKNYNSALISEALAKKNSSIWLYMSNTAINRSFR